METKKKKEGKVRYDSLSFKSTTLANGIELHAASLETCWQAFYFTVHSGAAQDPPGLEGLAHFTEHMLSENIPCHSYQKIQRFLKINGDLSHLGTTDFLDTHYFFYGPASLEVVKKAINLYGLMLIHARLQKALEREKEVILGEIWRKNTQPYTGDLNLLCAQALYPTNHPLYQYTSSPGSLGSKKSVNQITASQLQKFYDCHYNPANISIIAIGRLALNELTRLLQESPFGVNKPGERTPRQPPLASVPNPSKTRCEISMSQYFANPQESGFFISHAVLPGIIKLEVMKILVSMIRDTLYEEIRNQNGWVHEIRVWHEGYSSLRQIGIACEKLSWKAMPKIEARVKNALASLVKNQEVFEDSRSSAIARIDIEEMAIPEICRNTAEDLIIQGRIISLKERKRTFQEITLKDIDYALQFLNSERRWTAISVP